MPNFIEIQGDTKFYLAEFLGTAILVFFAAGSVMVCSIISGLPGPLIAGAASGLVLMILIWTFVGVSGAHFNPALTVSLALLGNFPRKLVLGYVIAQMFGSVLAGAMLYWTLGSHGSMGANLPNAELGITGFKAFVLESFLSFFMMLVIRGSFAVELPSSTVRRYPYWRSCWHRGYAYGANRRCCHESGAGVWSLYLLGRLAIFLDLSRRATLWNSYWRTFI